MKIHLPLFIFISWLSVTAHAALPQSWPNGTMPSLAPMLDAAKPAVVNIATQSQVPARQNPLMNDPFFRRFFNFPQQQRRTKQSLGSGVIVDAKKGLVLTNNHVIQSADEITVSLTDGRSFTATFVGSDPATDVALIRIPPQTLNALTLADSDQLRVGDFVVAIGNPFGLGQTVTSGIVSALGRSGLGIEGFENFIQTDASINPGNSGGALVNLRGELVGINTAIFSPGQSAGNIGIGFAIPSNMVKKITQQLLAYGKVRRAELGVNMQDITPQLASAFNLSSTHGAVVTSVQANSTAQEAGLKVGDVILKINDQTLNSADSLRNQVGLLMIGDNIRLTIMRQGKTKHLRATAKAVQQRHLKFDDHRRLAGATFGLVDSSSPYYGRLNGIYIHHVKRNSPAWRAGLRKNDIITSVNKSTVSSLDTFSQLIHHNRTLLINLIREGQGMYMVLK